MDDSPEQIEAAHQFRKFLAAVMFVATGAAAGTALLTALNAAADPQWQPGPDVASGMLMTFLFYALFATAFALPGFWLSLLATKRLVGPAWFGYPIAGCIAGGLATLILIGQMAFRSGELAALGMFGALNLVAGAVAGLAWWMIAHRPGQKRIN